MFNRLRELSTGGGGTGASTAPLNASLTFNDGDAVVHHQKEHHAPYYLQMVLYGAYLLLNGT